MKLLKETHNPKNTPEPFKSLLYQLEKMKNQQIIKLKKVSHYDPKHMYGYDLCEMLLRRYLENRIGFEMPPTPDFSKYLKNAISELYNNFEKIKVVAFLQALKNDYVLKHEDYDSSWDDYISGIKNIDMLKEEKQICDKLYGHKFDKFYNSLVKNKA